MCSKFSGKVCSLGLITGLVLILTAPAFGDKPQPDQLNLGTSNVEFNLIGNGPGTTTITLSIQTAGSATFTNGGGQTVTCNPAPDVYLLACGSGSGSGALSSSSGTPGPAFYMIASPSQTPITVEAMGDNIYVIQQTASLDFTYSSPEGNLTGTIDLDGATWDQNLVDASQAVGVFTATGGSFASVFPGGGEVFFSFSTAVPLDSIVGTNSTNTGQVEFPGTIIPSVSASCDFLTGGGWIPNPTGGGNGKATLAITGGCKHCSGWGHLNYIDHATGMHAIGDPDPSCPIAYSVVSNGPTDSNGQPTGCRRMRGDATINGQTGFTYDVTACDNGEPGTSDTFSITLSNGYTNSGTLGGGVQGGGNIQLHKGNKSFCCANQ